MPRFGGALPGQSRTERKNKMEATTINVTPTWVGIMPALIMALQRGTEEGKRVAADELMRLAREVDAANGKEEQ